MMQIVYVRENIATASQDKLPAATYAEAERRLDAIGIAPGK
jgi:hypothetical protein